MENLRSLEPQAKISHSYKKKVYCSVLRSCQIADFTGYTYFLLYFQILEIKVGQICNIFNHERVLPSFQQKCSLKTVIAINFCEMEIYRVSSHGIPWESTSITEPFLKSFATGGKSTYRPWQRFVKTSLTSVHFTLVLRVIFFHFILYY